MTCSGLDFSPWFLAWAALIFFSFFFSGRISPPGDRTASKVLTYHTGGRTEKQHSGQERGVHASGFQSY